MTMTAPLHQVFWYASRAFGITAMLLLAVSVGLGLAMSGRLLRRPGWPARLKHAHESLTLVTVAMVALHAVLLLFDSYLRPGLAGITVPFLLPYRPLFTGAGIIAGWAIGLFALSFYVRRWIGTRTWRALHRFTVVAYGLALVHVAGAGTDATQPWMLALLTGLTAPIVFGLSYRILARPATPSRRSRAPAVA